MKKFALVISFIVFPLVILPQSQFGTIAKFGVAVGFSPMWIIPNVEPINQKLSTFGVDNLPTSGLFTWGGGGYAYILLVENVRIGGMGYGGSMSKSSSSNGINRQVDFSTSGGAFTIEYTLPFIKKVDVSVGMMIGGGSQEVNIYKNDGNFSWNGIWDTASDDSTTTNISGVLSNSYFTLTPTINIDLPLNRFLMFRLGGGYIFSMGNNWTTANDQTVQGVPSDLNGNSFYIQTGIYFGFFAF